MGKKQSKLINLEGDVKFMENYVEGAGMICHRWNKKHGFLGKLKINDILKLQRDLKLEILQTKKPTKKEKRKVEYKFSDKWLEQSKLRNMQRQEKEERRKEKLTAAVLVRPHEETVVANRQRGVQPPAVQEAGQEAAAQQIGGEIEGAVAVPKTPINKQEKLSNPFKTEEQSSSSEPWSPNFWGGTGVQTRSKDKKTIPSIYPGEALMAHEQRFHPSGKNLEGDTFPLVEVANPNVGDANHPQPPTILVYRPWTQEDRTAALKVFQQYKKA
ncbi:hypothetical protein AMECASPLE_032270 [Ameca splendens]|uniref:Uncharacterized protein n=1 Tax=Ameca splendens TaxID=208324 RepID=A0ABV0ZRE7_9TELE